MNPKTLTTNLVSILNRAAWAVVLLTAASCFERSAQCAESFLPFITCQPNDIFAKPNEEAVFRVEAIGTKLSYQWHFVGGGETANPVPIPGANQSEYQVPPGAARRYGLYFCTVENLTDEGSQQTQMRFASLGGPAADGAAGPFMPVQVSMGTVGGGGTVCSNVVGLKVAFPGWNTNNASDVGFRGNVWKVVGSTTNQIDNDHYYLQWFHNIATGNQGCCTNIAVSTEQEVGQTLVPNRRYKFTAFFKPDLAPPAGTLLILRGTWTQ